MVILMPEWQYCQERSGEIQKLFAHVSGIRTAFAVFQQDLMVLFINLRDLIRTHKAASVHSDKMFPQTLFQFLYAPDKVQPLPSGVKFYAVGAA